MQQAEQQHYRQQSAERQAGDGARPEGDGQRAGGRPQDVTRADGAGVNGMEEVEGDAAGDKDGVNAGVESQAGGDGRPPGFEREDEGLRHRGRGGKEQEGEAGGGKVGFAG